MSSELENEYQNTEAEDENKGETRNPDLKWYVIHTYSGYENKVKQSIDRMIENGSCRNLISRVYIPTTEEIEEAKDGSRKTVIKRSFPGYVLVEMVHTKESWYWVRNVRGVTGFVSPDPLNPTPLTNDEVRTLGIDVDEAVEAEFISGFSKGDRINIVAGPLSGYEGIVESIIQDRKCIKATLSIFGRNISAELEYSQVEKAD